MGRNGEGENVVIFEAPGFVTWLYRYLRRVPIVKKVIPPPKYHKAIVVQGAFNMLFKPGLRNDFIKEYDAFSTLEEQIRTDKSGDSGMQAPH